MKRTYLTGIALLALGRLLFAAGVDPATTADRNSLDRFIAAQIKKAASPPFAFDYGGKHSSEFLGQWASTPETHTMEDKTTETIVYRDPASKLRVTAFYTVYSDFSAAEWFLRFKNEGTSDTQEISDVLSCTVNFDDWPEGETKLYRARGSDAQRSDFAPILDTLSANGGVLFGPSGGRSSDTTALPFLPPQKNLWVTEAIKTA